MNNFLSHNELFRVVAQAPQNAELWKEFARRFHAHICGVAAREIKRQVGPARLELLERIVQQVYGKLLKNSARALKEFRGSAADSSYRYLEIITLRVVLTNLEMKELAPCALQTTGTAAKETTEL